jgi:ribosomal protein L3 glutamine methyltransferase
MNQQLTVFPTINDALIWAEQAFIKADLYYGHGTDNAWDEAIMMTFITLGIPFDSAPEIVQEPLTIEQSQRLLNLYQERIVKRIPAAYLIKEAWFNGLPFYVDERVIIPRSPIAELIEQEFRPWIKPEKVTRILDLCTGSGCIAIACADVFREARIDAVDISLDALAVAKINVEDYALTDRVHVIQSDLFTALEDRQYDIIVSNPPYVDEHDLSSMPIEFNHEPTLALAAGEDGLVIVRQILALATRHLTSHGILVVEVGNSALALEAAFPNVPFTWVEFEHGGDGVFLLTKKQLLTAFSDMTS